MTQGYLKHWCATALPVLGIGALMAALGYGMMPTESAKSVNPRPTQSVVEVARVADTANTVASVSDVSLRTRPLP